MISIPLELIGLQDEGAVSDFEIVAGLGLHSTGAQKVLDRL